MYNYKIWNKIHPVNGCPADKILQGRFDLINDDVILIYNENNTHQIIFMDLAHGVYFNEGDTIDDTAKRHIEELNAAEIEAAESQKAQDEGRVEIIPFTQAQYQLINEMITKAVKEAKASV